MKLNIFGIDVVVSTNYALSERALFSRQHFLGFSN